MLPVTLSPPPLSTDPEEDFASRPALVAQGLDFETMLLKAVSAPSLPQEQEEEHGEDRDFDNSLLTSDRDFGYQSPSRKIAVLAKSWSLNRVLCTARSWSSST